MPCRPATGLRAKSGNASKLAKNANAKIRRFEGTDFTCTDKEFPVHQLVTLDFKGTTVGEKVKGVKASTSALAAFPFQLTRTEYANLKSQFVSSCWGGGRRATTQDL
jgi:hypothetical protein